MHDRVVDGESPCEKRLGLEFDGPAIPIGASVEDIPITAKDRAKIQYFEQSPGRRVSQSLHHERCVDRRLDARGF